MIRQEFWHWEATGLKPLLLFLSGYQNYWRQVLVTFTNHSKGVAQQKSRDSEDLCSRSLQIDDFWGVSAGFDPMQISAPSSAASIDD